MIYRDRNGRWWCRLEREGRRVWFCAATPHEAGRGAASVLYPQSKPESGDFVFWRNRYERRYPGQNPHDIVPTSIDGVVPSGDAVRQEDFCASNVAGGDLVIHDEVEV